MFGFLAGVCAAAMPPKANGSARAVVMRNFLNIDVCPFPKFQSNQLTDKSSRRKNRANERRYPHSRRNAREISHVDNFEGSSFALWTNQRLRNFGVSSEFSEAAERWERGVAAHRISYPAV
jgi:hypothetical protein